MADKGVVGAAPLVDAAVESSPFHAESESSQPPVVSGARAGEAALEPDAL